jgi:hypothetical protein
MKQALTEHVVAGKCLPRQMLCQLWLMVVIKGLED